MSKGETAADAILRIVKQNEQLTAAAEILKEFGSLENAVEESKKRLAAMREEEAKVRTELDEFMASMEQYKADALLEISSAKTEAKRLTDKSKDKASDILMNAEAEASAKRQEAEEHLANTLADNESRIKALKGLIEEKTASVNALDTAISDKTVELAELNKKFSKVNSQIAKLAGGTAASTE